MCAAAVGSAQRVAVLAPEISDRSGNIAERFAAGLGRRLKVFDLSMAEAAFNAARPSAPYNMTDAEARAAAAVIGCDTLVLLRSETLRRSALDRPEYYESYAAVYVVDGRSGRLLIWDLAGFAESTAAASERRLADSIQSTAESIAEKILRAKASPVAETIRPKMDEFTGSEIAFDLKPPVPYKRIKPEYTKTAYLYGIRATVEVEADVDETGNISRTAVVRWAGYGLDESAVTAVRSMNWRPAMRGGTPLPMRVLLRYNFTKVEKK